MEHDNEHQDAGEPGERDSLKRFRERSETDLGQQSAGMLAGVGSVVRDQLDRLWTMSRIEQFLLFAGLGIAAVGLLLVFSDVGRGSTSEAGPPIQVRAATEEPLQDTAAAAVTEQAPIMATPQEPDLADNSLLPELTAAPNRTDCLQISGTPYRSPEEQAWYLANCNQPADPVQVVVAAPTAVPSVPPTARPPTPEDEGFTAADAISFGIRAIGGQIDGGSCTASQIVSIWLVSCQASGSLSTVCVREPSGAILPSSDC